MTTYLTASELSANHCAYRDASIIDTVSGINNIFSFILFLIIFSFLVPNVNANKWRQPGVSLFPTPTPTPPHCRSFKGKIHYSLQLQTTISMPRVVVMVTKVVFEVKEEEGQLHRNWP